MTAEEFFEEQIGGIYFSNKMTREDITITMADFAKLQIDEFIKAEQYTFNNLKGVSKEEFAEQFKNNIK